MDKLSFLEGATPDVELRTVEAEPEALTPPVEQAPEPTPEPPVIVPVAEAAPVSPPPGYVPLSALMDERDKRKAIEAETVRLRAAQPQPERADFYVDPEAFAEQQTAIHQQIALTTKLDLSEDMARQRHGEETVDKARDWALQRFAASPAFQAEVLSQRNPYEFVVAEHRKQELLGKIGDGADYEAFLTWKAAQTAGSPAPVTAAPAAVPPLPVAATPTRSLASAPSAGGVTHVPIGPGLAFDGLFQRG